jgi:hypothetical protein
LKYNLHWKPNNWLEKIALEAETAISYVDLTKHTVAEHLTKIQHNKYINNNNNTKQDKHEWKTWKTLKTIKEKIIKNNVIITRADKGRKSVLMEQAQYDKKIMDFLQDNGIRAAENDPTNVYQSRVKKVLIGNEVISHIKNKGQLTQINPEPPSLEHTSKYTNNITR